MTMARRLWCGGLVVVALVAAACTDMGEGDAEASATATATETATTATAPSAAGSGAGAPSRLALPGGRIRLVQALAHATVTGPLFDAAAELNKAPGRGDTGASRFPAERVWAEDFDGALPKHWLGSGGCVVAQPSQAVASAQGEPKAGAKGRTRSRRRRPNRALRYAGRYGPTCAMVVPVLPNRLYRVSRVVLRGVGARTGEGSDRLPTGAREPVDLVVLETKVSLAHPTVSQHPADVSRVLSGRFVAEKDLLTIHHFASPTVPAQVLEDTAEDPVVDADLVGAATATLHLLTGPQTRSLALLVHDPAGVVSGSDAEAWFDNIAVHRLTPTVKQHLTLLKDWAPYRPGPASVLPPLPAAVQPLAKHGQLLPTWGIHSRPPADHNYDVRTGILAPSPTTLSFDIQLPAQGPVFTTALGLAQGTPEGSQARFEVVLKDATDTRHLLHEQTLTAVLNPTQWHWHELALDLASFAGQRVTLILKTHGDPNRPAFAVWGDPGVDARLAPGFANASAGALSDTAPRHIVLIAIDTLRADRLSSYGYKRSTSPNIDTLAADGVRFDQAISPSNWTSAAFGSLFTGVLPSRHQVIHRARQLPWSLPSLAEHLRDAGYATAGIAYKAYLYNMGFERGFDRWFNIPNPNATAEQNTQKALAWLQRNRDRRAFLFLHYNDPHQPFNQPEPYVTRFVKSSAMGTLGMKLPITIAPGGSVAGCRGCRAFAGGRAKRSRAARAKQRQFRATARGLYDGAVAYVDGQVGRVLAAMREAGVYDDALVVLVSDHGELMWEHAGYFGHGGPHMHDPLVRVPVVVKLPKRAGGARGKVVQQQVRMHDVMPTVLALAGVAPEATTAAQLDAASLVPYLAPPQPTDGELASRVAVSENVKQGAVAVRWQGWKLVHHQPFGGKVRERLFRLSVDPSETQNVAAAHPEMLARLRREVVNTVLEHRAGDYLLVVVPPRTLVAGASVAGSAAGSKRRDKTAGRAGRGGAGGAVPKRQAAVKIRLRGARAAAPVVGLAQKRPGLFVGQVPVTEGAVFLTKLTALGASTDAGADEGGGSPAGGAHVDVEVWTHEPTGGGAVHHRQRLDASGRRPYRQGELASLLGAGGVQVLWLGRDAWDVQAGPMTVNAKQLEALRALGYVQ